MRQRRNLVLCTAVGYRWAQIASFVRSLRRAGYPGDVLMLVGPCSAEDRLELSAHRITCWRIQPLFGLLPKKMRTKICSRRLARLHAALPWLRRHAPLPTAWKRGALAAVARYFEHITCARYAYYLAFLRRHGGLYDSVMTTDTRDVVFQADPFYEPPGQPLTFFLEHRGPTLGNEPFNSGWIRAVYGETALARLGDRPISCSGITLGTAEGMRSYLQAMAEEALRVLATSAGTPFIDQAIHNYLIWTGAFPQASLVDNGAGRVFTMHSVPEAEIHVDPAGHVVDPSGRIIPVLHQFDRHPSHVDRIRALLG